MHRQARRVTILAFVGIAVGAILTSVAVGAGTSAGVSQSAPDEWETPDSLGGDPVRASTHPKIVVTEEFRLTPDRPGAIEVQWHFEVPDSVSGVETRVPDRATNVRTDAFTSTSDSEGFATAEDVYEWTGEGTDGSITFTVSANVTAEARTAEATGGRYQFVDAGSWALVPRRSSPPVWYRYVTQPGAEDPTVVYRNRTAGPGVVGEGMVYLGEYDEHRWEAHDQSFRFVVPRAATLSASPADIRETMSAASDRLRVGERDPEVLLFAAPTSVPWDVWGLQRGDSDFYVLANQSVADPDNVWLHEYVHTRQDGNWTAETRWLVEASAEYYAALFTLQQDRIDFDGFSEQLSRGTYPRYDDVRLVDPETWLANGGDYSRGALVTGTVDRRLREVTDGRATFQSVLRRINRNDDPVSQTTLLEYVEAAGGPDVVESARTYTETTDAPRMWSVSDHRETFGSLPAVFEYRLPAGDSGDLRVTGPYRNGSLERAILVDGETLVLEVTVRNVGNEAGGYNLSVAVDDEVVATRTGSLDADAATTETVEIPFEGAQTYELTVGDERLFVQVRDPAEPRVVSMEANRSNPALGDRVLVTAQVDNPEPVPAVGSVRIRRNGSVIAVRDVRLAPGEETTVSATTLFVESGHYRLSVEELNVTVTAGNPDQTPTATQRRESASPDATPTPGASGPGFGVVASLLTLLGVFFRRRR